MRVCPTRSQYAAKARSSSRTRWRTKLRSRSGTDRERRAIRSVESPPRPTSTTSDAANADVRTRAALKSMREVVSWDGSWDVILDSEGPHVNRHLRARFEKANRPSGGKTRRSPSRSEDSNSELIGVAIALAAADSLDPDGLHTGHATVLVVGGDEHDRVQRSVVAVAGAIEVRPHDDGVVVGEHGPGGLGSGALDVER